MVTLINNAKKKKKGSRLYIIYTKFEEENK